MIRVRIAQRDEIAAAAEEVAAWGYPRPLADSDRAGLWVEIEDGARRIGWYWLVWVSHEDVSLHACVDPANRNPLAATHVVRSFAWVAELMGARRIRADMQLPGWKQGKDMSYLEVRHG